MFKKFLFFLATTVAITQFAIGQTTPVADSADDNDTSAVSTVITDTAKKGRDLKSVEVRAIRASDISPFAKTNISGAELQKSNLGQDIPLLLQYTPSVVTNSDAGTGIGYTGIHIRGTDPTRINITFNGMPVNDPEEQATFFVDIPDIASSTSSIQIQRGVGTSTNGAGSFGGTISINNLQQMDSAGVIYNSSYGSFNTFKNTLVAGTGLLKGGWQFDVRMSRITSDGYINRSSTDLKSMQFTAGWTPNERTSFHFLFMPGSEKTGQAWDGVPQDSLGPNRKYNDLGQKPDGSYYSNTKDGPYTKQADGKWSQGKVQNGPATKKPTAAKSNGGGVSADPLVALKNHVRDSVTKLMKLPNLTNKAITDKKVDKKNLETVAADVARQYLATLKKNALKKFNGKTIKISAYDKQKQVYTLVWNSDIFNISVPLAESEAFKTNWSKMTFADPDYYFDGTKFRLSALKITNTVLKKTYTYDVRNQKRAAPSIKVGDLDVALPGN